MASVTSAPTSTPTDRPGEVTRGRIVLVRHGETDWSRSGKHTGLTDVSLNDHGRAEAESLGRYLRQWRFSQIRTSSLSRARDTARLAGLRDPEPTVDEDLCEWNYGDHEGRTSAEIHQTSPGWTIFADSAPGGETVADVERRVDRVIERCRADLASGRDVALVAHGHLLRVLAARWLNQPGSFGAHLALDAGSVSVLDTEHGMPLLRTWNRTVQI